MKRFEWDEQKAARNLKKHKVSFDEAATVFNDSLAKIFADDEHSADEFREILIGHSNRNRLLLVSFTERGDAIRIISCRAATPSERKRHEEDQGLS